MSEEAPDYQEDQPPDPPDADTSPPGEPAAEEFPTEPPVMPTVLAEPGVYVCIAENAGEHAVLGVLTFGEEYDYSATQDERTLAAVAACVDGGYLEKV